MSASPIRDSAGKLAITPGVWVVNSCDGSLPEGRTRCSIYKANGTARIVSVHLPVENDATANAALIAEAGTVTNQTGRTPAELLRERDEWEAEATRLNDENERLSALLRELRLCLVEAHRLLGANERHISGNDFTCPRMTEALAKSEGV
jgi:hypothetical protein